MLLSTYPPVCPPDQHFPPIHIHFMHPISVQTTTIYLFAHLPCVYSISSPVNFPSTYSYRRYPSMRFTISANEPPSIEGPFFILFYQILLPCYANQNVRMQTEGE